MFDIKDESKKQYKKLKSIIESCKNKQELINKLRQENVIIDEFNSNNMVNVMKDNIKVVIDTSNGIDIKQVEYYNINLEKYLKLF